MRLDGVRWSAWAGAGWQVWGRMAECEGERQGAQRR
jgi:hypothetical protein